MSQPKEKKICVIGAGPAGISCAYYLGRLGYSINLFDEAESHGGYLHKLVEDGKLPKEVLERELSNLMLPQITFHGNWTFTGEKLQEVLGNHAAVFLTVPSDLKLEEKANVFIGGRAYADDKKTYEVVHAASDGRKAAKAIHDLLER